MSELQTIAEDLCRWVECADEVQVKWHDEGRPVDATAILYEVMAKRAVNRMKAANAI